MPSHFVQVLEGPRERVLETFQRISKDPRHSNVHVALEGEVEARRFGDWAMTARLAPAGLRPDKLVQLPGVELERILLQAC